MKINRRLFNTIFALSALLILVGIVTYMSQWSYAPYLFTTGATGIAMVRLTAQYKGSNLRLKRLYRIEAFASVALVATSGLMFIERPEWFVLLLVAAALQLYTAFMIPSIADE